MKIRLKSIVILAIIAILLLIVIVIVSVKADINLHSGWNLVASPYDNDVSIEQGVSSLEGCYQYVFSYQDDVWKSYNYLKQQNTLLNLSRVYGYWVKINCSQANWSAAAFLENCSNYFDDDLDGSIDCDDNDCFSYPGCGAPNGYPCNSNSQCTSDHCQNNFCCSSGDCCNLASDCPGSYNLEPVCDDSLTCQGHRADASCTDYICSSSFFDDDTGCDVATLSNDCSYYLPVYCNGQVSQSQPTCPTSCVSDGECDANAHCDGTCQLDLPNGNVCDENSDCSSNICFNGICCNQYCSAPNANPTCAGGTCSIESCISPYDDCDLNYANGCEVNLNTNVNHCGSCGNACNFPHANEVCQSGTCVISSCETHYVNCNANNSDGCEVDLGYSGRTENTCATAIDLTSLCGDEGADIKTILNRGSKWYKVRVDECYSFIEDLSAAITLASPGGSDYDLQTYRVDCSSNMKTSATTGTECLDYTWSDNFGGDDTSWIYIKVYHYSGSVCGNWTLHVYGYAVC